MTSRYRFTFQAHHLPALKKHIREGKTVDEAGRAIGMQGANPGHSVKRFLWRKGESVSKILEEAVNDKAADRAALAMKPRELMPAPGARMQFCCLISTTTRDILRVIADRDGISIAEAGSRYLETLTIGETSAPIS